MLGVGGGSLVRRRAGFEDTALRRLGWQYLEPSRKITLRRDAVHARIGIEGLVPADSKLLPTRRGTVKSLATVSRDWRLPKLALVAFEEKLLIAFCKRSFFVLSQTILQQPGDSDAIVGCC